MRKAVWILGVILILAMCTAARAATPLQTWKANETTGAWSPDSVITGIPAQGNTNAYSRAWKDGQADGYCNLSSWSIAFSNSVDLAQWIKWGTTGTSWRWQVRKPGWYATDCIEAWVESNATVTVTLSGIDDLKWVAGQGYDTVTEAIETYYAFSNNNDPPNAIDVSSPPAVNKWVPATWFYNYGEGRELTIADSDSLHNGLYRFKMFNMIKVAPCNTAGNYSNSGTITITKTVNDTWIDESVTGEFASPFV